MLKTNALNLMGWKPPLHNNEDTQMADLHAKFALRERLEEVLVLELLKDGGRNYLSLSIRSLYRHVMAAITSTKKETTSVNLLPPVHEENSFPDKRDEYLRGGAGGGETGNDASSSPVDATSNVGQPPQQLPPTSGSTFLPAPKRAGAPQRAGGRVTTTTTTYRERLGGYLHPRDMRKLFTPFSSANEPELIVRRHAMLLNFDPFRCIILRDRLLVLVPDGADSILTDLERRVRGGNLELERSFFPITNNTATTSSLATDQLTPSENETLLHSTKNVWNRLSRAMSIHISRSSLSSDDSHYKSCTGNNALELGQNNDSDTNSSPVKSQDETMEGNPEETTKDGNLVMENSAEPWVALDQTSLEWADMSNHAWIELPFELQCTDAVLQTVVSILSEESLELQQRAQLYIQEIIYGKRGNMYTAEDPLSVMMLVQDSVQELISRVNGFLQSLHTILDDYEDMALMNLSRLITNPERFLQPVPTEILEEESDEPELILESYLQQAMSLANKLNLIQGQVDTTAELIHQKLDANRNKILLANTILTTSVLCVGFATFIAALFGMNLTSHLEDSDTAFFSICGWTSICVGLLFAVIMYIMYRCGAIPSWNGI